MQHAAWATSEEDWPSSPEELPLPLKCHGQELAAQHKDTACCLQIGMANAWQKVTKNDEEEWVNTTRHTVSLLSLCGMWGSLHIINNITNYENH